jgi:hypothetical protein
MIRRRINLFIPVGMLALAASSVLRHYMPADRWDFAGGLLVGASIGLMIVGLARQSRKLNP